MFLKLKNSLQVLNKHALLTKNPIYKMDVELRRQNAPVLYCENQFVQANLVEGFFFLYVYYQFILRVFLKKLKFIRFIIRKKNLYLLNLSFQKLQNLISYSFINNKFFSCAINSKYFFRGVTFFNPYVSRRFISASFKVDLDLFQRYQKANAKKEFFYLTQLLRKKKELKDAKRKKKFTIKRFHRWSLAMRTLNRQLVVFTKYRFAHSFKLKFWNQWGRNLLLQKVRKKIKPISPFIFKPYKAWLSNITSKQPFYAKHKKFKFDPFHNSLNFSHCWLYASGRRSCLLDKSNYSFLVKVNLYISLFLKKKINFYKKKKKIWNLNLNYLK